MWHLGIIILFLCNPILSVDLQICQKMMHSSDITITAAMYQGGVTSSCHLTGEGKSTKGYWLRSNGRSGVSEFPKPHT